MEAPRQKEAQSWNACANPHAAIPRFGFQVKAGDSTFIDKLEAAIDDNALDDAMKGDTSELFELFAASGEDIATVLRLLNKKTGRKLCLHALDLEEMVLRREPDCSALERLACRNVVSASCAASGGHRDNYGGSSNKTNERLETKMTFPAPNNGGYKFPCSDGVYSYDWVDYTVNLSEWTEESGANHGGAPPGCLTYPELLLGTICPWNADIEGHVLHQVFHCSARADVSDDYLQRAPGEISDKVRKALVECNRGVWGLDEDLTPRFYRYGGVVTTYRQRPKSKY